MATRWRWRPFKLEYMKFSSVFNGFWWVFAEYSMIFGIFGTLTRRSVHPTVPVLNQKQSKCVLYNSNFAKKREYPFKSWKKESQQHPVFPGGHPSKYWLGSMLLNFSDRTRTGVFNMIWPLARIEENFNILFQHHTCIHIRDISILCANLLNMPISET